MPCATRLRPTGFIRTGPALALRADHRGSADETLFVRRTDLVRGVNRVRATGGWTFTVGPEFELLDNGDSIQAVHGDRVVYVSSMKAGFPAGPDSAAALREIAARSFGAGPRLAHVGESVQGDAEFRHEGDTTRLFGTMCAPGTVATCVVDFKETGDGAWAETVWRSLLCDDAV